MCPVGLHALVLCLPHPALWPGCRPENIPYTVCGDAAEARTKYFGGELKKQSVVSKGILPNDGKCHPAQNLCALSFNLS